MCDLNVLVISYFSELRYFSMDNFRQCTIPRGMRRKGRTAGH